MPRYALLMTVLALVLTACGGGSTTPTPPNPPVTTPPTPPEPEPTTFDVAGTANGFSGAAGTVRGYMFNSTAELTTGTVAANGVFSIALPSEVDNASLADSETFKFCLDNPLTVSPANWQADVLTLEVLQSGAASGELVLSNAAEYADAESLVGLKQVSIIYSAAVLSVTGVCNDAALGGPVTYNLQLQPGWNYAVIEVTADDGTGTFSTVSAPPTDVRWDFIPKSSTFSTSGVQGLPQWSLKRR